MKRFRFNEEQLIEFDYRFEYRGSVDDINGVHVAWVYADFALQMFGSNVDGYWLLHEKETDKRVEIHADNYHDFLVEIIRNLTYKVVLYQGERIIVRSNGRIIAEWDMVDLIDPNSAEIIVTKKEAADRYIWLLNN